MAEEQVSQSDERQIDELHQKLIARGVAKGANVCDTWKLIKPYWSIIVTAAKWIPKVGKKVSDILEKLGQALDAFCPAAS